MHEQSDLSIKFGRDPAERSGHLRVDDFIPFDPLLGQSFQGLELIGF